MICQNFEANIRIYPSFALKIFAHILMKKFELKTKNLKHLDNKRALSSLNE